MFSDDIEFLNKSVENIEDIEDYNPAAVEDDVLMDDWRILIAWTAQKIEDGDW